MTDTSETPMVGASLVVDGVSKSYDGHQAVRNVSLTFRTGELVGIVGPNGAGKSTLIKILDGVVRADTGTVRATVAGATVRGTAATDLIGVVHQDLGLLDALTVLENLRLGMPPLHWAGPLLSRRREHAAVAAALHRVGLTASVTERRLGTMTLGEKALVAVARTLATGARFLIIDEATSTLSPRESSWLLQVLRERVSDGCGVLLVSHKLSEILDHADRCVVMVDGRVAADVASATLDKARLTQLMGPREAVRDGRAAAATGVPGAEMLRLREARTAHAGPFDLAVHAGQVVGVTGLVGSRLYELAFLAAGATTPTRGRVEVAPGVIVALVPPDRATQANFSEASVEWNLSASSMARWRGHLRLLDRGAERRAAEAMRAEMRIHPVDVDVRQSALSGGNQQKVLLGRALLGEARVLVLCEPTRGVDVSTRQEIYGLIRRLRGAGHAILIVSSDAEDLLSVADLVGVVDAGVCRDLWAAATASSDRLTAIL